MNERYFTANRFFRQKFGHKTRKIPLNAGFSCPNRDGTLDTLGCIYCDQFGSGPLLKTPLPIDVQIESHIKNQPDAHYIAYFQAFSNTYAPADTLRALYAPALRFPQVKGVFIGTRPDCLHTDVFQVLIDLSKQRYVCVELGLQSIHETSLKFLNRHHDFETFRSAFRALKDCGLDVLVHLILGIPGESTDMMRSTILEMNRIKPRGIKLHMLHVLRRTQLEALYQQGNIPLFNQEQYVTLVADLLESLDPDIVVHRLTGERNRELFVAPVWALDKVDTLNRIHQEMRKRDTWQGKKLGARGPMQPEQRN
ncbi:MAG TPA: TIGR01212 family radical SAM protein [Candidatus Aminicenantes bacterium]|nr:TIGR01212 family radical SAM protein [Candidatus Aminicenantes bacterium]